MPGDTDTASAPTAVPPDHACAACGYLMGPAGGRTCSECGRVATEEDLKEATRRRLYLEATLLPTAVLSAAVPIAGVALLGQAPYACAYAILASLHVGIIAAALGRWGSRIVADRVVHVATLRSAWALHVPLLAGIAALAYMEDRRWLFVFGAPRHDVLAWPDALGMGAPLLVLLGVFLHRMAARRAYRIAGVGELARERTTPLVRRAWLYPPLFVSALIAIGYVLHVLTR